MLPKICEITPRTPFQRSEQVQLLSKMLKFRKDSIPVADGLLLRQYTLQVLSKEEEDITKGKSNSVKLRQALKFVQQVRALDSNSDFIQNLEEIFLRLISVSNSPAVKQILLQMSSSKDALAAAAAASAAAGGNKKKRGIKDDSSSSSSNKKNKVTSDFFKDSGIEEEEEKGEGKKDDDDDVKEEKKEKKKKEKKRSENDDGKKHKKQKKSK